MKPFLPILGAVLLAAGSVSHAAVITWSSASYAVEGDFGGDPVTGVFNQTGTLVYAQNVGGNAEVFDGISFSADSSLFGDGSYNGFHEGESTTLFSTGRYGSAATITLGSATGGDLIVGQTYRLQLLFADGRSEYAGRTVSLDGINQGSYANGISGVTWGTGLLVTGTFVADATTQTFFLENFSPQGTSVGSQLNGLTLYAVPEPSTALLLGGLGLVGFVRRRRA